MTRRFRLTRLTGLVFLGMLILPAVPAHAQDVGFRSAWPSLSAADRDMVMAFGEDFKTFMGKAKSEMTFVREARAFAETAGFKPWTTSIANSALTAGSRWFAINRDRTIVLWVIGSRPLTEGLRIVNTHIDSVRIEFRTRPFRESQGIVLVDTQVHGGLKNYQWVNRPLAVIGRVDKTDGSTTWIDIGNDPADPVLLISDLAPHVDRDFRSRTQPNVVRTEELDPILASLPPGAQDDARTATDRLLGLLEAQYGLTPRDFISADLQIVPAEMPRDVGLDRALVGAFGHDDRATAYVSLRALAELDVPSHTAVAYAVNNEEVGSWNTGVNSEWFNTLVAELISAQATSVFSDLLQRRAYGATEVLVSDCTTAINPVFPQPQAPSLTSRLGYGLVIKEYGAGRESNAEFVAKITGLFDREDVRWQTHSYQAGYGGGTIASWFASQNMEVMDVGIGILSMHSPYDVSSKVDLWELYRGFQAFFRS